MSAQPTSGSHEPSHGGENGRPQSSPQSDDWHADLATAFRRRVLILGRQLRQEKGGEDVSDAQMSVLALLMREGPKSPSDIARAERVKPPSMTRMVTGLESAGLVSRTLNEIDARSSIISINDVGMALVQRTRLVRQRWLKSRLDRLSEDEVDVIRAVLPIMERISELSEAQSHSGPEGSNKP